MSDILEIKTRFEKALEAKSGWGKNEILSIFNNIVIDVLAKDNDVFDTFPFTRANDMWECDNSPTDYCIYNKHIDPVLDGCIICGEPFERK